MLGKVHARKGFARALQLLGLVAVCAGAYVAARSTPSTWSADAPVGSASAPRQAPPAAEPPPSLPFAAGDASGPAAPEREPAARPADWTASAQRTRWQQGDEALPDYLRDDEPMMVQLRQLRLHVAQERPELLWSQHVAPILAPDAQAVAQSGPPGTPSQAELEAFRAQLGQFSDELAAVLDRLPEELTMDASLRVTSSSQSLAKASYDELAQVRAALYEYPGFWDLPAYLDHALSTDSDPWLQPSQPGALVPNARPTLPSVPADDLQYDNCLTYAYASTCSGCPQVDGVALLSAAFALEVAAKGVELSLNLCPKKIFIVSKTFYSPCALILAGVKTGIDIAAAGITFALEQADECEEDYHLGLMHLYLDETVSSRASEQSHDYHALRTLRIEIENSLLRDADDRVGLFQLPASQGGYLDAEAVPSVRFVVLDTIRLMDGLGYDVRNAEAEYADAETLLDQGDYQGAFARYRLAYRAAVRVGRELPPVSFP